MSDCGRCETTVVVVVVDVRSFVGSFVLFVDSSFFLRSFVRSCIRSFVRSIVRSNGSLSALLLFVRSFGRSFVRSLVRVLFVVVVVFHCSLRSLMRVLCVPCARSSSCCPWRVRRSRRRTDEQDVEERSFQRFLPKKSLPRVDALPAAARHKNIDQQQLDAGTISVSSFFCGRCICGQALTLEQQSR